MRIFLVLIVFLTSFSGQAQVSNLDSLAGATFYEKGESFFYSLSYDSARENYQKSMDAFKSANMWEDYFESLYSIGFVERDLNLFDKADSIFRTGMELCEQQIGKQTLSWVKLCRGRGLLREKNNEFDSAIVFLTQALEVFAQNPKLRNRMELLIYEGLGNSNVQLGQWNRGLEIWKKLLQVAKERYQDPKFDNYKRRVAIAHEQIGVIYSKLGEQVKAEAYLNEALSYWSGKVKSRREYFFVIKMYNTLGNVYVNGGKHEEALKAYHSARSVSQNHLPKGDLTFTYAYSNLGDLYLGIDNDSSKWYSSRAKQQIIQYAPGAKYLLALANSNLGLANYNLGKYDLAISDFKEVLSAIKSFTADNHLYLITTHHRLAKTYGAMGDFQLAFEHYEKAMQANLISNREIEFFIDADFEYLSPTWMAETIYEKSLLSLKLGKEKTSILDELNEGITLCNKIRDQLSFDQDKGELSNKLHQFHALGASICYELFDQTKNGQYLDQFLDYSERDKAFSLKSYISKQQLFDLAGVPDSLVRKNLTFDREIQKLKVSLAQHNVNQEGANKEHWDRLAVLNKEQEAYANKLKEQFPTLAAFNSRQFDITIADLASNSSSGQSFIEYFVTEKAIYTLVVSNGKTALLKSTEVDSLTQLVSAFRETISQQADDHFYESSHRLFQLLFKPVEDYLHTLSNPTTNITIIPDGLIGLVSFDALVSDPKSLNFLLDKYVINYETSLQLAFNRKLYLQATSGLLSFAPSFERGEFADVSVEGFLPIRDSIRGLLGVLPGALKEIEGISSVFDGDLFSEDQATKKKFKEVASNYQIIHFATHALADHERPDNSKLFLSKNEENRDGSLHAYEIYGLDLNAQLVTLSACNTGFGKIKKGEGVMSLSRAFAYAGVPATVVSLWPASDKSTPELMTYFYQNLKDGQAKDVALNNARKQYLATAKGKARHPFYWGGFVLIGDSSPLEEDSKFLVWIIPSVLLIVMILTVYRRKRDRT